MFNFIKRWFRKPTPCVLLVRDGKVVLKSPTFLDAFVTAKTGDAVYVSGQPLDTIYAMQPETKGKEESGTSVENPMIMRGYENK